MTGIQPEEGLKWDLIIKPSQPWYVIPWRDIWLYRDLLGMFIKRDVITVYKQTILGPLWYLLQPILTTLVFMLVFGKIAKLSTDGMPQVLFYLSGVTMWNYFQESFNSTSKTFRENATLFGKVYFPRLIMPFAKVCSALIKFFIQMALFLAVFIYFLIKSPEVLNPNRTIYLLPLYLFLMAILGLGFGLLFTSLTSKYRDLNFLIQFGIQLLMYASPVIYPLSSIPSQHKMLIYLNPLSSLIEGFRYAFLGSGIFRLDLLIYTSVASVIILFIGIIIFSRTERNFIDTV